MAALQSNPGSADIMTNFASRSVGFGEAQRGADLVARVLRVNPNYPTWATGPFSYTYIMADRYRDALHVLEQRPSETYTIYSWVHRAVANAALDNTAAAKVWVAKALGTIRV